MNFVKKIVSSIRDLFSKKAESASPKNNAVGLEESETSNESKFLTLLKKVSVFIYAYLKRFLIFVLGLINTMMQPMIKISKKHPIAFGLQSFCMHHFCLRCFMLTLRNGIRHKQLRYLKKPQLRL